MGLAHANAINPATARKFRAPPSSTCIELNPGSFSSRPLEDPPASRARAGWPERSIARAAGAHPGFRFVAAGGARDPGRKPHWFRSLADPENIRRRRAREPGFRLRYRNPLRRVLQVDLVLLDTSASTQLFHGLARAKGAIRGLARQSYIERARFGIVTFGNDRVDTILAPQRTPYNIDPVLERIRSGGGTPLHRAIDYLDGLAGKLYRKEIDCRIFILTDGKVRGGVDHRTANLERARTTVVDLELGNFRLGRSRYLARRLGADYLHIDSLAPPAKRPDRGD